MLNVLICPAHNYVMPYGVMLQSLFESNLEAVTIYAIVDDDVTHEDKESLNEIAGKFGNKRIVYCSFTNNNIDKYPGLAGSHLTKSAYFRLYASSILPKSVSKVLYLDGDVIVLGSLSSLYDNNIEDYAIAGVMDHNQNLSQYNRLQYSYDLGYINSGVTLLNLDYWREYCVENRLVDFIIKYPERISGVADQDVINCVLRNEKIMLPLKYNVQNGFFFKPQYSKLDYWKYSEEIIVARENPVILHYSGPIKPWLKDCVHPKRDVFLQFRKKTIWADTKLMACQDNKRLSSILKYYVRKILQRFNILQPVTPLSRYIDA